MQVFIEGLCHCPQERRQDEEPEEKPLFPGDLVPVEDQYHEVKSHVGHAHQVAVIVEAPHIIHAGIVYVHQDPRQLRPEEDGHAEDQEGVEQDPDRQDPPFGITDVIEHEIGDQVGAQYGIQVRPEAGHIDRVLPQFPVVPLCDLQETHAEVPDKEEGKEQEHDRCRLRVPPDPVCDIKEGEDTDHAADDRDY